MHEEYPYAKTVRDGWPAYMFIPDSIGKGFLEDRNGQPCCSLGHFLQAAKGVTLRSRPSRRTPVVYQLSKAYVSAAYEDDRGLKRLGVADINDSVSPDKRLLYYQAALYVCGYTEGVSEDAAELGEKVLNGSAKTGGGQ